jgi:hypothetical protein
LNAFPHPVKSQCHFLSVIEISKFLLVFELRLEAENQRKKMNKTETTRKSINDEVNNKESME